MANEMFGAPTGQHIAEQDFARMALLGPQIEKLQAETMLAPYTAAQRIAQSRYLNSRADGLEKGAALDRNIANIAQNTIFTDDEKANPGWKFAQIALEAGSPDKAMAYAGKASQIDTRKASAATNESRQGLIQARTQVTNLNLLSGSLSTVDGPEKLQSVLQNYEAFTKQSTGMLGTDGMLNPQVAESWERVTKDLRGMALTERDRVTADFHERQLASAERERASRQRRRDFFSDFENIKKIEQIKSDARGKKAGADLFDKTAGVKLAVDELATRFNIPANSSEARVRGQELADRAKQLRAANPALTPREAIGETFKKMEEEGKFAGLTPRVARPGVDAEKPLPLPVKPDGSADTSKPLIPGNWYADPKDSKVARQWTSSGWGKPRKVGEPGVLDRAKSLLDGGSDSQRSSGKIQGGSEDDELADDNLALEQDDDEEDDDADL